MDGDEGPAKNPGQGPGEPTTKPAQQPWQAPDDASELALDELALQRERQARRRRSRLESLFKTRRWHRYGLSGPLVVVVLLIVAVFGGLLALVLPSTQPRQQPEPLAAAPAAAPGSVGGLLPEGVVRAKGGDLPIRTLRPAVVAVVEDGCDCAQALRAAGGAVAQYRLAFYVVPPVDGGLDALLSGVRVQATPVEDPAGTLRTAYPPRGLTLVLVRADGVVDSVVPGVREDSRLEVRLQRLVLPAATMSPRG